MVECFSSLLHDGHFQFLQISNTLCFLFSIVGSSSINKCTLCFLYFDEVKSVSKAFPSSFNILNVAFQSISNLRCLPFLHYLDSKLSICVKVRKIRLKFFSISILLNLG